MPAGGDSIFMDISGRTLVTMPLAVGVVLIAALLIAFIVLAAQRPVGRGIAVIVGTAVGSAAISWLALLFIGDCPPRNVLAG